MLCCITFLLTSLTTNADPISVYGGTYVNSQATPAGWTFYFDQNQFQNITSISGTESVPTYTEINGTIRGTSSHGSTQDNITLIPGNTTVSGHSDSITLSVSSTNGTTYSHLDFNLYTAYGLPDVQADKYYEVVPFIKPTSITGATISGYEIEVLNLNSRFNESWSNHILFKGSDIFSYSREFNGDLPVLLFHLSGTAMNPTAASGSLQADFGYYLFEVSKDSYDSNVGESVHDSGTQQGIDKGNQIAQENTDTNKDTNNKVTNFFNGFWDNLLHIFVPEDGFFSQWFSNLNEFMSQKLGFLWSPFDFMLSFLNGVYNGSGTASIVFPELSWIDGTVIIPRTEFSFDNIGGQSFQNLRDMIYFATDVVLLGAVISQFYKKIKLVFEGGGD